jgi:hypothetical protein
MVDHITTVVNDYEKRLRRMLVVPLFSYERHWRCQRSVAGSMCNTSASIRYGSWFQQSNLTLFEILLLTYDFVCRVSASQIQNEYAFSANTVADWGMFCRETMLVFLEGCSVQIGGPNKTVEIDDSKRLVLGFFFLQKNVPRKVWVLGGFFLEKCNPLLNRTFLCNPLYVTVHIKFLLHINTFRISCLSLPFRHL